MGVARPLCLVVYKAAVNAGLHWFSAPLLCEVYLHSAARQCMSEQ